MTQGLSRNQIIALGILALAGLQVLAWNEVWWHIGGSGWSQGDWLINNAAGPVRRGLFGSALLAISDRTGINLLTLVLAAQVAATAAIYGTVLWLVLGMKQLPDRLLPVLLSPAFLLFWANDFNAIGRKEILALLAFLPLVVAAQRGHRGPGPLVLAVLLFVVSGLAHEANLFFLPFLGAAIHLHYGHGGLRRVAHAAIAVLAASSAVIMAYALAHSGVKDPAQVCAPLLSRGLAPHICEGAITWLGYDLDYALMRTGKVFFSLRFPRFVLVYGLMLLPFWYVFRESPERKRLFGLTVLSGLVFLPLYFVALDWGRWMNFHITALVFVILVYTGHQRPEWLTRPLDRITRILLLFLSLTVGIFHMYGTPTVGFVLSPVEYFYARSMLEEAGPATGAARPQAPVQ